MKTNSIARYLFVLFVALILWGCKKDVLGPTNEEFKVKSIISNIKSYNVNSEYVESILPTDTSSNFKPYISVNSWVIKGKDILISISVPSDAEELYFGATNSQAEYMGLNFEDHVKDQTTGYYRLKLSSIPNPATASYGLRNYQVVLSSNENIQIDNFDLLVSYKTTEGISNVTSVPINVSSIAPYQKNLKVGFRPLTGYSYTIQVSTPSGAQITYSYNKDSGTESFNNSQVPNTSLSYDSGLDFKWIDFSDPEFGGYSMTATIHIDLTGGYQYIYLYLAIITEGIIDQVSLDADIQQTGQNTAVGTANVGFKYFENLSVKVKMTAYRYPYAFNVTPSYPLETIVPDDKKNNPGVGIRFNGNSDANNLLKVVLEVDSATPPDGVKFYLRRSNQNINVWGNMNWNDLIMYFTDQVEINFNSSNRKEIWVDNVGVGSCNLELLAMKNGEIISSDIIIYKTYKSVVIVFGGEFANPPDPGQGVWDLADGLFLNEGYDVYKFNEDNVPLLENGPVYNFIVNASQNNELSKVCLIGYSHGGASVYRLAYKLMNNSIDIEIPITAYVDAIQHSPNPIDAERRIPCRSEIHLNYYQRNFGLAGNSWNGQECGYQNPAVIQFDASNWTPGMDHSTIHTNPSVLNGIRMYLKTWVNPF